MNAGRARSASMTAICILTPEPSYEEDWRKEAAPLAALFGDRLVFRRWDDAGDLRSFDLVLPLLAWGYQRRSADWSKALDAWTRQGARIANPVPLLRWNTDKAYLLDLAAKGVPIVPSRITTSLRLDDVEAARAAFGTDAVVVKPTVSGGADGTYLLLGTEALPVDVIGRSMLIQPKMDAIITEGEFSLFYFSGQYSHAIIKRPARGDFRVQEQFGGHDSAVEAPPEAFACASQALSATPVTPLYARVDMVRGGDRSFRIMELELIEPSLFLHQAPDGGAGFVDAVRNFAVAGVDADMSGYQPNPGGGAG